MRARLLPAATAAILVAVFAACGSSSPTASSSPPFPAPTDAESSDVGYQGSTTGSILPGSQGEAGVDPLQDATVMQNHTCCNVVFSIPAAGEPSGTTGVVVGSDAPLLPPGLPLTLAGGTWSAPACVPIQVSMTYAYVFTEPVVSMSTDMDAGDEGELESGTGASGEAGVADADSAPGTDAGTAAGTDAGTAAGTDAADAAGGAGTDAASNAGGMLDAGDDSGSLDAATTVTVERYNPNQPTEPDGLGNTVNVYNAVTSCSSIDATSGMSP